MPAAAAADMDAGVAASVAPVRSTAGLAVQEALGWHELDDARGCVAAHTITPGAGPACAEIARGPSAPPQRLAKAFGRRSSEW